MINSVNNIKLEQEKIIFKIKKYVRKQYKIDNFFFIKMKTILLIWLKLKGNLN